MRIRSIWIWSCLLLLLIGLLSGCDSNIAGPTYTQDSVLQTLKQYGVTAHYPIAQGEGRVLSGVTGKRYLLQIDYIDQYEVKNGWAEVYLYPDVQSAYEEALQAHKDFEDHFHHDEKIAELQGKKLEKPLFPLFQHGNVILYGIGIAGNQETLDRITKTFGQFN